MSPCKYKNDRYSICFLPFVVGPIRKLSLATTNCTGMSGGGGSCKRKNRN